VILILNVFLKTDAPALMEAVSFCAKKLIFPGRKERPEEAPFMALEKCFFKQKIQAYSRNSSLQK
jgi:hypothetical protein